MQGSCKHMRWIAVVYLIAGLAHLIPQLYMWLSSLTGGTPWIQMVVGALVVIASLMAISGKSCNCGCGGGKCEKCGSEPCKC